MRQNFTVAGPFGELRGVINLCEVETKRRNVLVMAHGFRGSMEGGGRAAQLAHMVSADLWKAADGLRNWRMKSENPFALWFVSISAGAPC